MEKSVFCISWQASDRTEAFSNDLAAVYNGNKLDAKGQTEERQKNLQGFDK